MALGLLDEHDKLLEQTTTNQNGGFEFDDLANNSSFSIVILDSGLNDHNEANIRLTSVDNKPIKIKDRKPSQFFFKSAPGPEIADKTVDQMTGDGTTFLAGADNKNGLDALSILGKSSGEKTTLCSMSQSLCLTAFDSVTGTDIT